MTFYWNRLRFKLEDVCISILQQLMLFIHLSYLSSYEVKFGITLHTSRALENSKIKDLEIL